MFQLLYIDLGASFLVWRYILSIFRSSWSIKVIGLRSRACVKNDYLLILTCYSFVCRYRVIKYGEGHISRSRSNQCLGQIEVICKARYSID